MESKTCRWHQCNGGKPRTFTPERKTQDFCSAECRLDRASWKQRRGATLVDLVIEGKWTELRSERASLKKETGQ